MDVFFNGSCASPLLAQADLASSFGVQFLVLFQSVRCLLLVMIVRSLQSSDSLLELLSCGVTLLGHRCLRLQDSLLYRCRLEDFKFSLMACSARVHFLFSILVSCLDLASASLSFAL